MQRAEVEPARPYGQRILSPFEAILPDLTQNEMNQYFPNLQPSKSCFVRLGLTTKCRHLSVILLAQHQGLHLPRAIQHEKNGSFSVRALRVLTARRRPMSNLTLSLLHPRVVLSSSLDAPIVGARTIIAHSVWQVRPGSASSNLTCCFSFWGGRLAPGFG